MQKQHIKNNIQKKCHQSPTTNSNIMSSLNTCIFYKSLYLYFNDLNTVFDSIRIIMTNVLIS